MGRNILIVNQSTVVNSDDFTAAVSAVQKQITEHFAPAWGGLTAFLSIAAAGPAAPQAVDGEAVYVLDDSDQMGALGYHEVAQGDVPVGFVFARTCQQNNIPWQTTLSHEVLEQLADPYTTQCAVVPFSGRPAVAVEFEVCDPVENDSYQIDGVPVSNFVFPAWFQPAGAAKGPYDQMGRLTNPLTLTGGGYVGYSVNLRKWLEITARKADLYYRHNRRRAHA